MGILTFIIGGRLCSRRNLILVRLLQLLGNLRHRLLRRLTILL